MRCQSQIRGGALPGLENRETLRLRSGQAPGHPTRLCLHVLHTGTQVSVQKAGRGPLRQAQGRLWGTESRALLLLLTGVVLWIDVVELQR